MSTARARRGSAPCRHETTTGTAKAKATRLGRLLLSPDAPWEVLSVTAEDAGVAVGAIETHGLQPADAFHYAVCRRECESCIITNDRHFRALPELNCVRYDVDV